MSRKLRVGLALGGGGARGLAHIGVLKVLEANQIPIDMIAGTSIGAIVGAVYALNPKASVLEQRALAFLQAPEFHESGLDLFHKKKAAENFFAQVAKHVKERVVINLAPSRISLLGGWRITRAVEYLLEDRKFENCRIPFACVAADLITGEEIVFRRGSLRKAVAASMSIPGFLPPVQHDGHLLVDGAVVALVPVKACKLLGADLVIAVDVSQSLNASDTFDNVIDIVFRASSITAHKWNQVLLQDADVIIRPRVGNVHWSEFHDMQTLIAEGENAAKKMLRKIERLVERKPALWRRWFGR
ncbi:MAG: patatin-like phospholipase family protein [candidate division KSB1 bacterium]|nr:patatin-like phospholipase family protein [candidate division KSB1 bacterium]MDZ7300848.1 patatin-like phospholipase family protein [candidate division KSB1 bacterium]MDZ7309881.1 patatin-like phospholipase family protein [candidate division KSB1 bacterium]